MKNTTGESEKQEINWRGLRVSAANCHCFRTHACFRELCVSVIECMHVCKCVLVGVSVDVGVGGWVGGWVYVECIE